MKRAIVTKDWRATANPWLKIVISLVAFGVTPVTHAQNLWTAVSAGITANLSGVSYAAGQFVAVGESGTILTSPDGVIWARRDSGTSLALAGVGYGNGLYVVGGDQGTLLTSPDGITWTARRTGGSRINAVAYGNGTFLAVDEAGGTWRSTDGVTWLARATGRTTPLRGLVYTAPCFVLTGGNGTVTITFDGETFFSRSVATNASLDGVAFGQHVWVAVGGAGATLTSRDTLVWSPAAAANTSLHGLGFFNNAFIGVGDNGAIATTFDGNVWTPRVSGTNQTLLAVAASDAAAIAVGFGGTILRSTPAQVAPTIAAQPVDVTEAVGGNVAFTVSAQGSMPLRYQWSKNGNVIAQATNDSLWLTGIAAADAGSFACVVNNSAGSATSRSAVLTVLHSLPPEKMVDETFLTQPPLDRAPTSAIEQPDGKIIIGGDFLILNQGIPYFGLARLHLDGSLDSTFRPLAQSSISPVTDVALQPDGKILVTGRFTVDGVSRSVVRLNSDGTLDAGFTASVSAAGHLAITADNKILVVSGASLLLLNSDGSRDPSLVLESPQGSAAEQSIERFALQPDGKIIVAWSYRLGPLAATRVGVVGRFNRDGSRGTFTAAVTSDRFGTFNALKVLPDGRIAFVFGRSVLGGNGAFGLRRMLSDGSADPSFTQYDHLQNFDFISAAGISNEGEIWVAGASGFPSAILSKGLVRFSAEGSLDLGYNTGGGIIVPNGIVGPTVVLPLDDGRVIIAGPFIQIDSIARKYLARLNGNRGPTRLQILSVQPASIEARAGESINLTVVATGSGQLSFAVSDPNGVRTSDPAPRLANPQKSGVYNLVAVGPSGSSSPIPVYVRVAPSAPLITRQPVAVQTNARRSAVLSGEALGSDPRIFQWYRNDNPLPGATNATLSLTTVSDANTGNYTLIVRNSLGVAASETVHLGVDETSRLANLATRGASGTGENVLVTGFAVSGPGNKTILLRGIGPALGTFGVSGFITDPAITVYDSTGTKIAENNDWAIGVGGVTAGAFAQVAAFALPTGSRDAALVTTVPPGNYTVHLSGTGSASGIGLVELYEFDVLSSRIINVSSRLMVGPNALVAIPGIVVSGTVPKKLLIRGVGPTLAAFGVQNSLADPALTVVGPANTTVAANDNWGTAANAAEIAATTTRVGAFALPAGSRDAAIVVTLPPGAYTVLVSGVNETSGVALVEVYEVP